MPGDLLTIIYTSGTTGNPKGVMLTHGNLATNVRSSAECIPFGKADTILSYLPLCHSFERMAGYYTAMSCGVTIAFAESIDTLRENLLEVRPTVVTTVPRLFERIHNRILKQIADAPAIRRTIFSRAVEIGKRYARARRERRFSPFLSLANRMADLLVFRKIKERTGGNIRFFVSGGAALPKELGLFFEAVGIPIIEGYGMTEASPVISVNRVHEYRFGTVGKPIPGVTVRIAGDGEILTKGPNVMKGYWNNQKETFETIDAEGWLHTGDIGMIDVDGFLSITDRKKHLFVTSGGKNIAPQPIENLLQQSHYIDQFILIGDRRMFCSALIVPDFEALKEYGDRHGLPDLTKEGLIRSPEIRKLIEGELDHFQKDLSTYERVRRFTLLDQPFTIENGEMTPSLKLRRRIIEEKFKPVIETMYAGHT
jgi:long-chain acyl-CoA synthetase